MEEFRVRDRCDINPGSYKYRHLSITTDLERKLSTMGLDSDNDEKLMYCQVKNCVNRYNPNNEFTSRDKYLQSYFKLDHPRVTYLRFPKNESARNHWFKVCGFSDNELRPLDPLVCTVHFQLLTTLTKNNTNIDQKPQILDLDTTNFTPCFFLPSEPRSTIGNTVSRALHKPALKAKDRRSLYTFNNQNTAGINRGLQDVSKSLNSKNSRARFLEHHRNPKLALRDRLHLSLKDVSFKCQVTKSCEFIEREGGDISSDME